MKQPKCPLPDEWINKMWYLHKMQYYSVIKRNEIQTHATTWVNSENITLSERSQSQKATYCMVSFIWNVQNRQTHRDERLPEAKGDGKIGGNS